MKNTSCSSFKTRYEQLVIRKFFIYFHEYYLVQTYVDVLWILHIMHIIFSDFIYKHHFVRCDGNTHFIMYNFLPFLIRTIIYPKLSKNIRVMLKKIISNFYCFYFNRQNLLGKRYYHLHQYGLSVFPRYFLIIT